jgi:hypothetical protein
MIWVNQQITGKENMFEKIRKPLRFTSILGLIIIGLTVFSPKISAEACYCLVRTGSGAFGGPCQCQLQWSGNFGNCIEPCIMANYANTVLAATCGANAQQECNAALTQLACQPPATACTIDQGKKGKVNRGQKKKVRK